MKKIVCVDSYGITHVFAKTAYIDRHGVYGILIKDNNILLVKDIWGKRWGLPGGGIDPNESEEEALAREFKEETGITIAQKITELFSDLSYFLAENETHPWKSIRKIYRVTYKDGTIQESGNNIDVCEVKYFPLNEINNIDLQPNTRTILEIVFNEK